MDELTENLQKLNMIKAKFDQTKDMSANSPTYSKPGTKKAPTVPPKPRKNDDVTSQPLVPTSTLSNKICKPSYVTPLVNNNRVSSDDPHIYANANKTLDDAIELQLKKEALEHRKKILEYNKNIYANSQKALFYENINNQHQNDKLIYSNLMHPPPPLDVNPTVADQEEEFPAPPSPVSSSYSELRRATDTNCYATTILPAPINHQYRIGNVASNQHHIKNNTYSNDYGIYGPSSQNSTTYESIYEPINPRPPSQMSSRSNYSLYAPYVDGLCSNSSSMNRLPVITQNFGTGTRSDNEKAYAQETEVDALTDLLVQSIHQANPEPDNYGTCCKCEGIVSEALGCTAMEKIYHIACFTCNQCQTSLQGKPFYALDDKPFCEEDYLNTLEKCCVCLEPITERILRATGKPYHPQCFTCVVCGKSLDGIPFTVDATNKIHCIEDFHKRFAPRCSVCKQPIMPEPGKEETIRVVALDRSFHINCYKCEDCGLLLSSEAVGSGCFPLDDHVLCKNCNAKRVQALTSMI